MPLTEPTRLVLKKESVAATDTNIREVSLLLQGDGTNGSTTITDSSLNPKTVTAVGDAQVSTAVADPFGNNTGVLAFDGTGDYLTVSSSSDFAFGTGDFTVEVWINKGAGDGQVILDTRTATSAADGFTFSIFGGQKVAYFTNNSIEIQDPTSLVEGTWIYYALARASGTTRLFRNGTIVGSKTSDMYNFTNTNIRIAERLPFTGVPLNGYISNLRITKGVARYTSNFTPPTAPFPDF